VTFGVLFCALWSQLIAARMRMTELENLKGTSQGTLSCRSWMIHSSGSRKPNGTRISARWRLAVRPCQALPSLVRYRSEAPPGRISATSEHRPFRSEEKQQDSKSLSIGSAFTGDTDMTIWRKRPCVDRIFRIIHLLRGKPFESDLKEAKSNGP
jgi:hypothetical protein